jgi:regulator of sirC expression with transglutaminase-like and TPR domain
MQPAGPTASFESLPESKRAALITLLTDDDPAIYQTVRSRLLAYGPSVCHWLRPLTLSSDPCLRRRTTELVRYHACQAAHQRFQEFCQRAGENADLETAIGLMAKTRYPEINPDGYSALLDEWSETLREKIFGLSESGRILEELNRYVFDHLGFAGNEQYGLDPDCSFFNKIMDRRTSNPIGLCVVYLLISRRLQLPIAGVGLPGHFVCRFQSTTREIYIDCFRRGALLSKGDCVKYLLQAQHESVDSGISPVSNRRILLRMCVNLLNTCRRLEMDEDAVRVQTYVQALGR